MGYYLVVIEREFVRDTQICPDPELIEDNGEWRDASGHFVLGVYAGKNKAEAIKEAVAAQEFIGLNEKVLEAYGLRRTY